MQEPALQPSDLNRARAKPLDQAFRRGIDLHREAQQVPLYGQITLVFRQSTL